MFAGHRQHYFVPKKIEHGKTGLQEMRCPLPSFMRTMEILNSTWTLPCRITGGLSLTRCKMMFCVVYREQSKISRRQRWIFSWERISPGLQSPLRSDSIISSSARYGHVLLASLPGLLETRSQVGHDESYQQKLYKKLPSILPQQTNQSSLHPVAAVFCHKIIKKYIYI